MITLVRQAAGSMHDKHLPTSNICIRSISLTCEEHNKQYTYIRSISLTRGEHGGGGVAGDQVFQHRAKHEVAVVGGAPVQRLRGSRDSELRFEKEAAPFMNSYLIRRINSGTGAAWCTKE